MAKGKETGDETRAQIVAALLTGQGVNEVARCYKVSAATVSRIRRSLDIGQLKQVETERGERIGDLIAGYLRAAFHTLQVQAKHGADKAWLNRQPASEVAVFHGVIADKAIRICEAVEYPDEADTGDAASESEPARVH